MPPLFLRISLPGSGATCIGQTGRAFWPPLKAQGTSVRELPFMESMIAIDGYDYLEGLDAFRKGWIQVQDVTSAFVGRLRPLKRQLYHRCVRCPRR